MIDTLEIGSSCKILSVRLGQILTGHINRNRPSLGFLDYPEIHTIVLRQAERKVVMVSIDLLEMDTMLCQEIRAEIASLLEIPKAGIMIACTHAHTMPAAIKLGMVDINTEFVVTMRKEIIESVIDADSHYEGCTILASQGDCPGVGVNRRKIIDGQVVMAPNPDGINDTRVLTYWFAGLDGRMIASLVNFNMHATVLDVSIFQVSADYPQYLRMALQKEFPQLNILFFNGACGDIRPNLLHADGGFRGGFKQDLEDIGTRLGESIIMNFGSAKEVGAELSYGIKDIELVYDYEARETEKKRVMTKATSESRQINQDLMDEAFASWQKETKDSESLNGRKASVGFQIQKIVLSSSIALLGLPCEIFVETGLHIKEKSHFENTMVVGYANGSVGYVPTEEACLLGGYEAQDAYKLYGHPTSFSVDTAKRIEDNSVALLNN